MALTLRLSADEMEALRRKAEEEGRSVEDVARAAISSYITDEDARFRGTVAAIVERDRELLDRLAR